MLYHKILFNFGEGVQGTEGYQVVNTTYGSQSAIMTLDGQPVALPEFYSFDFTQVNAPTPSWG